MNPQISNRPNTKFIGLKTTLRQSLDAQNNLSEVPALWQKVLSVASNHVNRIGKERYVLITGDLPSSREKIADYYALIAVQKFDSLPEGFVTYELKSSKTVKCVHKGSPQTLGKTAEKIFFEWLPNSKESIGINCELCIYPEGYDRLDPNAEFDYVLFLK